MCMMFWILLHFMNLYYFLSLIRICNYINLNIDWLKCVHVGRQYIYSNIDWLKCIHVGRHYIYSDGFYRNCWCFSCSWFDLILGAEFNLQVANAVDHVNMGTDALQTAKNLQKRSRKCMMIAIIILLVIAIIIVLSIIKPWKK